jgi:hypothetical protein
VVSSLLGDHETRDPPCLWMPETARTARKLAVRPRQASRHDPLMVLRLVYAMFSQLLSWIVLRARSDATNEIEILVLRHQLAVLQRRIPRPRMSRTDRALLGVAHGVAYDTGPTPGWTPPARRRRASSDST